MATPALESSFVAPVARALATSDDRGLTFARVAMGAVMFPHGMQKLCGWFGGPGFAGEMGFLTGTLHIPAPLAVLVILAESLGAIGLVLGAGTRLAAAGIVAVMLGAVALEHAHVGFFMNWFGNQAGEGFEYHLLAIGLALPLVIRGGGWASIDGALVRALDRGRARA